jgi:hypothetical protein
MATRYDRNRQQWVTEFEQTGIRVYRRHPRGIGKPQAEAWEVKRRREIYDRVDLDRKPDLTIGDAIDLWLQDNRRKNQKQARKRGKAVGAVAGKAAKGRAGSGGGGGEEWSGCEVLLPCRLPVARRHLPRAPSRCRQHHQPRLMMLKAVCKAMWRQKHIPENLSGRIQTLREPPHKDVYLTRRRF